MEVTEKKEDIKIKLEELNKLKALFTAIRIAQINIQQADLAYQVYCLELAKQYGVVNEQYDIDRLTGVVSIKPGSLPGVGGGPMQQMR